MRRTIITTAMTLLAGVWSSQAAVTVQGWWHSGETGDYYADSSGNSRRFSYGYSCVGSGNAGAGIATIGAGGPLGNTGYTSTSSTYWTPAQCNAAGMWFPATGGAAENAWNPPATNYVIECWILPEGSGISSGNRTWFFGSGSGDFSQPSRPSGTGAGGVYFAMTNNAELGVSYVGAFVVPNAGQGVPDTVQIGDLVEANTNGWTHIAVVNNGGTNTFYVNGVARGSSTAANTIPNGNIFAGCTPGTAPSFRGYLDELRISTFAPGAFSTGDLLLRPVGPSLVVQPQSATVWANGAANFAVVAALDASLTYQWRRGGANISGATKAKLNLPLVAAADSGATFDCVLKSGGISVTSSVATLTVVTPTASNLANAKAYRDVVRGESSLVAYFTGDDCTGASISNLVDASYSGTLEDGTVFDGRTDRALIQRSLAFDGDGSVQIPPNSAYDFLSGQGTVEALVYLNSAMLSDQTIFAMGIDPSSGYNYVLKANAAGNGLVFANGTDTLSWSVAPSLIGRRVHLAFVFDSVTNVTPYLNGQALETKAFTGLNAGGLPGWIGSLGSSSSGTPAWRCAGEIGELAIYSSALSANAIQSHYTKYYYGTNVAPAAITAQTLGPRTLIAGSSPVLNVTVSGAPPFSYQWKSNDVVVVGAASSSLTVVGGAAGTTASYTLVVTNVFGGATSQPIVLNFVAPAGAYAEKVAVDHPSAYWRLDEQTGTLAADIAGFNDATYSGSMTMGVPGAFGTSDTNPAVQFSGGHAVAPYSSTLNPAGPFSVEFWAKPSVSGQNNTCVIGSQNRAVGRSGYAIYQGLNGAFWECHIGDATTVNIWLQGTTSPQAGQWYHVVVVYTGATGAYLYVNGADETGPVTGSYLPNNAAAFEIASRYGGALTYPGTVDDVAFYNYALTADQVLNHFKVQWFAAQITANPTNVTATEGSTVTLSAEATGLPNTYQWYKGSTALVGTDINADGTLHYPDGVTGTKLTISQVTPTDAGSYHLVVSNPLGGATSGNATVVINKDTTAPMVTSVKALGTPIAPPMSGAATPYLVKVLFNKRIDPNAGTFTIAGATVSTVTVLQDASAGVLGGDWREVVVCTTGLTPGQQYTLSVSGVKDMTVSANPLAATNITFKVPTLSKGMALWDYYHLGTTSSTAAITDLTGSPYYPNGPMTNITVTSFDSTPITGGDLTATIFGALGEQYGASLSAWLTPTVSGDYTFFLASDDASELWLGSDPQSAIQIAFEPGCCHGFVEPTSSPTYTSQPIPLQAGTSYFIRALNVERTGGDYVKVAWRMAGDSTPAAQLQPIPGSYLSCYTQVPVTLYPTYSNGKVTLTWSGSGTLLQSSDISLPLSQWTAVPGNPTSPYTVTPTAGVDRMFYVLLQ